MGLALMRVRTFVVWLEPTDPVVGVQLRDWFHFLA
jgi:hypothetical protein